LLLNHANSQRRRRPKRWIVSVHYGVWVEYYVAWLGWLNEHSFGVGLVSGIGSKKEHGQSLWHASAMARLFMNVRRFRGLEKALHYLQIYGPTW